MKYEKKQMYIEKYNFGAEDSIVDDEMSALKMPDGKVKLEKYVYKQLKKILKNYSENLPPLYLIDRRTKTADSKYNKEKRHEKIGDRRKLQRRKNNFDRRHPQSQDQFSYTEDDRRREFSDRRDWVDIERRNIDKRKIIGSIKRISELIASYQAQHLFKKNNSEKLSIPKSDEILLLIKNHLMEGYPSGSEDFIYDLLTELKSFMLNEKFFCGKLSDDSLGFFYYWIDGKKKYFVKELAKKEFLTKLKIVPNYRTDKLLCCIEFDPFNNNNKCNVGICNKYTTQTKRRLQRTGIYKTLQNKLKLPR